MGSSKTVKTRRRYVKTTRKKNLYDTLGKRVTISPHLHHKYDTLGKSVSTDRKSSKGEAFVLLYIVNQSGKSINILCRLFGYLRLWGRNGIQGGPFGGRKFQDPWIKINNKKSYAKILTYPGHTWVLSNKDGKSIKSLTIPDNVNKNDKKVFVLKINKEELKKSMKKKSKCPKSAISPPCGYEKNKKHLVKNYYPVTNFSRKGSLCCYHDEWSGCGDFGIVYPKALPKDKIISKYIK